MDTKAIEAVALSIRSLSMDAIQKANSGHPGLPLGAAEVAAVLYGELLKHNPADSKWVDRDRFVLSAGHGSMLLYSILHLSGYKVSLDDIRDIYDIRARLEGLCARWAAEKITDELMEQMEEIIYLSEFHEEKGNSKQLLLLDNRFHEILYEASQSKELKRILKEYHEYVGRVRRVTLSENERAKDSTMEHKMICQAIKAHDADLAEKYASAHIIKSKEAQVANKMDEFYQKLRTSNA